ncbi:MAG: rRNA methyltransferase [Chlamydiia bacterium]|nr:rRNA methyltransferase [Chlamydiia bacterium]
MNEELEEKITSLCSSFSLKELQKGAADLTRKYHNKKSHQTDLHRLAYLATRMPATYAVLCAVFNAITPPKTVLDCGAGPGTSLWALLDTPVGDLTLLEKDPEFVKLGKKLSPETPFKVTWKEKSFLSFSEKAELILFSYSLNEIPKEKLHGVIERALNQTENYLVVVEPGTPEGFERIRSIRSQVLDRGFSLHAPCPHHNQCPMVGNDWCHFSARLPRTSLHRFLKQGSLGYEDEKYCYLIASMAPHIHSGARVLRHPIKRKGHVLATLCTKNGLEKRVIKGKEKKEVNWGALIDNAF